MFYMQTLGTCITIPLGVLKTFFLGFLKVITYHSAQALYINSQTHFKPSQNHPLLPRRHMFIHNFKNLIDRNLWSMQNTGNFYFQFKLNIHHDNPCNYLNSVNFVSYGFFANYFESWNRYPLGAQINSGFTICSRGMSTGVA